MPKKKINFSLFWPRKSTSWRARQNKNPKPPQYKNTIFQVPCAPAEHGSHLHPPPHLPKAKFFQSALNIQRIRLSKVKPTSWSGSLTRYSSTKTQCSTRATCRRKFFRDTPRRCALFVFIWCMLASVQSIRWKDEDLRWEDWGWCWGWSWGWGWDESWVEFVRWMVRCEECESWREKNHCSEKSGTFK